MKPLEILNRFPLISTILCAAVLVFITLPKAYHGAKLSGVIGGGTIVKGEVRDLEVEEGRGRRGRTVQLCYLKVLTELGLESVRIECSDAKSFEAAQAIELIKVGDDTEVVGYPFSSYKIDLFLALTEIFGMFYFGRKFLRERRSAGLPASQALNATAI